ATSPNMQALKNILTSSDSNTALTSDQQVTLNKIINQQWPAYRKLQDQELSLLQNATTVSPDFYTRSYAILFEANARFLDLKNSWQHIVSIAEQLGTIATTIDQSQ